MAGASASAADNLAAVSSCPEGAAAPPSIAILSKRADFLRAAQARRQGMPGFLLQARKRAAAEPAEGIRIGFTCSKKIGNAVARNRAKRRLREVARLTLPGVGRPGWDYVLVGRPGATATHDFAAMRADLEKALRQVHSDRPRPPKPPKAPA